MSADWASINREAASLPGGVPWGEGAVTTCGLVVFDGDRGHARGYRRDATGNGGNVHEVDGRDIIPDMRSPAMRGHLRAALGNPDIISERKFGLGNFWMVELLDTQTSETLAAKCGATRDEAEARALIAYARANGGWVVKP